MIRETRLTHTLLKHGLYTAILLVFLGEKVIETGTIFLPAGEGRSAYVSRYDLAVAGASVLTPRGHENRTYELGSSVAKSFHDIANKLGELSGKPIRHGSAFAKRIRRAVEKP